MAGDRRKTGAVSWRLRLLNGVLRRVSKRRLARVTTPAQAGADHARFSRLVLRRPPHLLRLVRRGAPDLHWISAGPVAARPVILYFHGGAYVTGAPVDREGVLGRLSEMCGLQVAAAVYRLAPEHPAPAQFEDAQAAHARLLALGYAPQDIILGGDSAGGGLALALLADLCARDLRPAGLFAFSPWTDLTLSGDSLRGNALRDPFLPAERVGEARGYFLCGTPEFSCDFPEADPRVSPLFARFDAPPPVQLHVGSTEILLDDTRRMAAHLRAAGGKVELIEQPEAPHIWPIFDGYIPEARQTLRETARFIAALSGRADGVKAGNRE
ncbi:MAG: alpha/beta hydrolase [Tropicimonas sp.]|uniref:alpha/beta hydrolase n=1 Tax=Tropicimonas sp. TaxID=2067044 RepID=UPI003A8BF642